MSIRAIRSHSREAKRIFHIQTPPKIPADKEPHNSDVADSSVPSSNASADGGYAVDYDERPEVDYKWYEAQSKKPLFAFGFGLSYTTYAYSGLSVDSAAKTVRFTVKNTGKGAGKVYARLPKGADESFKRLVGWKGVTLAPGELQTITVPIDEPVLKTFDEEKNSWDMTSGEYQVLVGSSSDITPLAANLVVH
jgi:beta-glucosidase